MSNDAFLITGDRARLGKDVARRLALCDDVDAIYLACRSGAKAQAAQADLQRITGRSIFKLLIMDTGDWSVPLCDQPAIVGDFGNETIHAFLRAPCDEERQT